MRVKFNMTTETTDKLCKKRISIIYDTNYKRCENV